MSKKLHPIPARDPVLGGEFYVSELRNDESDISLRGHFALPKYARLDPEQAHFLETFLRCRGTISAVEKELKMSYPTVRARLDALLQTLELTPIAEEKKQESSAAKVVSAEARAILDRLEVGEITAEEAKELLRKTR